MSRNDGGSGRWCRYQAHIIGTASFRISEGWKRTTPRSSQRCAPLPMSPAIATTTSSTRPSAYAGRREHAQEMVRHLREHDHQREADADAGELAEPERGVVARRAVQHEQPEQAHGGEARQQHAVEAQRLQQPRHAGDGAPRAGCAELAVDHGAGFTR